MSKKPGICKEILKQLSFASVTNPIWKGDILEILVNKFPGSTREQLLKTLNGQLLYHLPRKGVKVVKAGKGKFYIDGKVEDFDNYSDGDDEVESTEVIFRRYKNGNWAVWGPKEEITGKSHVQAKTKDGRFKTVEIVGASLDDNDPSKWFGLIKGVDYSKSNSKTANYFGGSGDADMSKMPSGINPNASFMDNDEDEEDKSKSKDLKNVKEKFDKILSLQTSTCNIVEDLSKRMKIVEDRVEKLEKDSGRSFKILTIEKPEEKKVHKLKNVILPPYYQGVLDLIKMKENILLIGPSGCGKTHSAKLFADILGLEFSSISCSSGISETHFTGKDRPNITTGNGIFQSTEFIQRYEGGGLFLWDELDGADPNVMLVMNQATANDFLPLPFRYDNPIAKRHKDFVLIATANTFGRGADRIYVGRNQLDEATMDRFRIGIIECYYDRELEKALCPNDDLRETLWGIRDKIESCVLRRVMSTRFIAKAHRMMEGCRWDKKKIINTYFQGWKHDEKAKVYNSVA